MVPFTLEGPAMLSGHAPVTAGAVGHIDHNHLAVTGTGHHHVHLAAGQHHLPAGHHPHLSAVHHHHHSQLIPVPGHGGVHMHAPPHYGQASHVHGIRYPPPQRGFTTVPPPQGSPTNAGLAISSLPPPSLQTANHICPPPCTAASMSLQPPPGAYPRHELAAASRQLQPQPQRLYLNKQQQQFRRKQKISVSPKNGAERENNSQEEGQKKILSAQELTGAPLISFATRNRKLKKKTSEPSVSSTTKQSQNYYVGVYTYPSVSLQDMYQNPMYSQNTTAKSTSALNSQQKTSYHSINQRRQEMEGPMKKTTSEPTFDSHSVSSEDLEHFLPRIIRPRRRRKKDRKEKAQQSQDELYAQRQGEIQGENGNQQSVNDADFKKLDGKTKTISVSKSGGLDGKNQLGHIGQEEPEMLGSEKQWLPQGLLSAESSYDSRSESGSSGEEAMISTGHRKLSAAMSMPVYPSYVAPIYFNPINKTSETSDYSSLTSNSSEYHSSNYNSSDTHGSDNQCDSDSRSEANSTPSIELEENGNGHNHTSGGLGLQVSGTFRHPAGINIAARQEKPMLVKSTSSSFFRSPKMSGRHDQSMNGLSPGEVRKRNLRKTNSWHPVTQQDDSMATFSLFSPAGSIDLLSGIRKNLSKLDINSETE